MDIKGGDKLNFIVRGKGIEVSKATGWESLRGVLVEFKGNYPTKRQLARAHISGLNLRTRKDAKNTSRYQRFA
ncbi:MAG: hypothetical protein UX91_C0007G0158 [Candidatus Amesbacteria bacterium GW2011_GWB1_47_19]|nr:MAG: hypothetical protein UW51_C0006G0032 [Candidatus Amesbacteria bacterium GW2011_GWA1_44_24]KKU31935.1 MAG: hypothetical protein UX46_C0002G0158 [Candidatus Amesbacteria bacterium GW2011_GWC1_46_24]KKU66871.1 MAG: hypothetical protein UX91_C0007G0158 [Candidatus Amesbacteria bacterium GW2011_GWB1_47_19]